MSTRRVRIVLLCEDSQHETFIRRFLKDSGWETSDIRVEKSPKADHSAEQYVRKRFPIELKVYRQRSRRAASALITIIDADLKELKDRREEFETECKSQQVEFRKGHEAVAIVIPKRNIETWIYYLNQEQVDEITEYPKLDSPRNCTSAVKKLVNICRNRELATDAPSSLKEACNEYHERIKPISR